MRFTSYEIPCVRYSAYFPLFSVIDAFKFFWMRRLHKNTQLMLEFLKPPSLILHFSYYTPMTFLIILSVILLFIMMKPLSPLSEIRILHLICGSNESWLLNLNLSNKTSTGVRSSLFISMLDKLTLLHLSDLIFLVLLV